MPFSFSTFGTPAILIMVLTLVIREIILRMNQKHH